MMKIALLGYGRMGKTIESMAQEIGHSIVMKQDEPMTPTALKQLQQADVAIEFSVPDAAVNNIEHCFNASIPVVVGTTGWYGDFERIEKACLSSNGTLFYATNFSIGVNLFFAASEALAQLMSNQQKYRASIEETHHIHKLDQPSGTAITLAERVIKKHPAYASWQLTEHPEHNQLSVKAIREDEVPGIHTLRFESEIDEIELTHSAKSRAGFAQGALQAAEWVHTKTGIFTMSDLLGL